MLGSQNIEMERNFILCASDCFETLKYLNAEKLFNSLSIGILAGHCVEVLMKTHLANFGWQEGKIKQLGQDLLKPCRVGS